MTNAEQVVKRYYMTAESAYGSPSAFCNESTDGGWCLWSDVSAIIAERDALRVKLDEFETWARATCDADCEPYRKIGRHAPNCPVGDLRIGDAR